MLGPQPVKSQHGRICGRSERKNLAVHSANAGLTAGRIRRMVTASVDSTTLHLQIEGMDKLWALKSTLDIPLIHVNGVRVDPPEAHDWWKGMKMAGAQGFSIVAGTFLYHGNWLFWDVHNRDYTIAIDLHDERYMSLIVEVQSPFEVAEMIQQAIAGQ